MILTSKLKEDLKTGKYNERFSYIYACENEKLDFYAKRYLELLDSFEKTFGKSDEIALFSAPGRTEIGGNHTDHQNGNVLAASVNLDIISAVTLNDSGIIRIQSEGYEQEIIDVNDLHYRKEEENQTTSLIRGIAFKFSEMGYKITGFDAYISSNVLKGSGLSSSAAFEVLIGVIINCLFCNGEVSNIEIAKIGQYAENVYFGKPCGLMDQMASSVGGIIKIDFKNNGNPIVKKIDFDFKKANHALCIVDTGGDHADLTHEYAAIPFEMKSVANYFGKNVLSEVDECVVIKNICDIRKKVGDRAVLRSMHFFADNKIVSEEAEALEKNDFETFKGLIKKSGQSSYMYLQNVYTCGNPQKQDVSVALMLCENILGNKGAYRIHGGGFAGTIQAFVPLCILELFKLQMENILGDNMCHVLSIRPVGGIEVSKEVI